MGELGMIISDEARDIFDTAFYGIKDRFLQSTPCRCTLEEAFTVLGSRKFTRFVRFLASIMERLLDNVEKMEDWKVFCFTASNKYFMREKTIIKTLKIFKAHNYCIPLIPVDL
jgi:hypothetical protein